MYPKLINGIRYCYKSIRRKKSYFEKRKNPTSRSLGRCVFDSIKCQKCNYYLKHEKNQENKHRRRRIFKFF